MAQVLETVEINAPPDEVWAIVGDPGRIGEWVPALADSTLEDDYRSCTMQDGAEIVERIVERSDEERYYIYEIASSPLPLKSYRSWLAVQGHGDHSHVVWEAQFQAESADQEPDLVAAFERIYREGLITLRDHIEVAAAA
jgi:mxaD protein